MFPNLFTECYMGTEHRVSVRWCKSDKLARKTVFLWGTVISFYIITNRLTDVRRVCTLQDRIGIRDDDLRINIPHSEDYIFHMDKGRAVISLLLYYAITVLAGFLAAEVTLSRIKMHALQSRQECFEMLFSFINCFSLVFCRQELILPVVTVWAINILLATDRPNTSDKEKLGSYDLQLGDPAGAPEIARCLGRLEACWGPATQRSGYRSVEFHPLSVWHCVID